MNKNLKNLDIPDSSMILGEGSFSKVFQVRSKLDNKYYALKKIDLTTLSRSEIENLETEIQLHSSLNHPNIIAFIDHVYVDNYLYILLEHSDNGCLFFYISSIDGLSESIALRVIYQVTQAIQYLHSKNILHRDLKPENILLDSDFNVKVCDFGWSSRICYGEFRQTVCGTFEYMAPEMLTISPIKYNHKLDIWCLGILFFEILHGSLKRQSSLQWRFSR